MASSIAATPCHTLSAPAALVSAKLGAASPSLFLALSSPHSPFPSLALSCPHPYFLVAIKQPILRAVSGATAAEVEEEVDDGLVKKGPAYTPPSKPKTGKAALPFKRDRVICFRTICLFCLLPSFAGICYMKKAPSCLFKNQVL